MMYEKNNRRYRIPRTVEEAADLLIGDLPVGHQQAVAHMDDADFELFYNSVGKYILDDFEIWNGNEELLRSCYRSAGKRSAGKDPARIILERVREILRAGSGVVIITG